MLCNLPFDARDLLTEPLCLFGLLLRSSNQFVRAKFEGAEGVINFRHCKKYGSGDFHQCRGISRWQSKPVRGGAQHQLCRVFSRDVSLNHARPEVHYHVARPFRAREPEPNVPALPGRVQYDAKHGEPIEFSSDGQERAIDCADGFQDLSRCAIAE